MENTYPMVAKTFEGLEPILRDELISLGAENVEMGRRMVSFEGDLELMYRANLCLRTALRVLKPIEKFTAKDPDELYDIVRDIAWEKYMTPQTTFAIDATVNSAEFNHSRFATYRVKDGIVDHFRDLNGERPSIRVTGYDLLFNIHIDGDRVTISLDSSGEPLSKRGYREEQTEAPINEALAAGIIMTSGWRGDSPLADPMCGSGTFLIEAALIAANINPGIYRKDFAFEHWPDFDADLFDELYNDDSQEREFHFKIYGGDIDPEAVSIARKNIKNAQVDNMVELSCRPFSDWIDNPEPGVLVMNPPYGHRLKQDDLEDMFRGVGTQLKRFFPGWTAWIIGPDVPEMDGVGLKPSMKIPLLNGSLECSLREYVMFDGRYNDFRADGGTVKGFGDEQRRMKEPKKMRRASDDEWKKDTRKFGDHADRQKRKPQGDGGYRKEGGFHRDGDYDKKDSFRKADGFRKEGGYRKDDGSRREGGFRKEGGYRKDGGFRKEAGFRKEGGYRKDDGFRKKEDFRRDNGPRTVTDRGPRISEDKNQIVNPVYFRSRRSKGSEGEGEED